MFNSKYKLKISREDAGHFIQGIGYYLIFAISLTTIASALSAVIGYFAVYLTTLKDRPLGLTVLYLILCILFFAVCIISSICIVNVTTKLYQRNSKLQDSNELGKYMLFNVLSNCALPISFFVHIPAGIILFFVSTMTPLKHEKEFLIAILYIYCFFASHFIISLVINGYIHHKLKKSESTNIVIPLNKTTDPNEPYNIRW